MSDKTNKPKKEKKRRKISLTAKLLLTAAAVLVAILVLFNFFGMFDFTKLEKSLDKYWLYIIGTLCIVALVTGFILIIYFVLLKRIKGLNQAVQKVAHGDYTVTVSEGGNDELTALSKNFNKMTAELRRNSMLSKDFVSYVSHEFKTPLSVIRTHAEALLDSDDDEEKRSYSEVIIGETDELTELSKNIIILCRLDSTNLIAKDDIFMPADQIRSLVLSTQLQWSAKNIDIELDIDDFDIRGNERLSYTVWLNLVGNAIKFTGEGGKIVISLHKDGDYLRFSVSDSGMGISDEDKEKIFSLFFTANKSRNKEGSGIGLYLTKLIVNKLGGEISFESELGKGSTFKVDLPV